jgi:hypothetical protein
VKGRAAALLLTLAGAPGCAAALLPAVDLGPARREVARAEASPFAELAPEALDEARRALAEAEAEPRGASAGDRAYVAQRLGERAWIAGRYAADRQALLAARGAAARLEALIERRAREARDLADRRRAEAEARAALVLIHRAALEAAGRGEGQLVARPDGTVLRLSVGEVFLPGTSLLCAGGEARLARIAAALRDGPPCFVQLDVLDDVEGFKMNNVVLHRRRLERVHATLRALGVPADWFLAPERHPRAGTQVDVVVTEQPVVLPSGEGRGED